MPALLRSYGKDSRRSHLGYELLVWCVHGWRRVEAGSGVQGYISLEPQLCAGLPGFSMPERCFKSHILVWLCESDMYLWGMGLRMYFCLLLLQGEGGLGRHMAIED